MTIGERWIAVNGRPSGFDYLRITLALAVAVWHCVQVAYGLQVAATIWTTTLLGPLLSLILPMFFALSGFLVAGSMYRNPNLRTFLTLRVIRIYPALVTEVVLVALILGPIVTTLPLAEYFTSFRFYRYLINMFGLISYQLPGVFLNNPYPEIINSQLWTVPFELECYVLAALCFIAGYFKYRSRVIPLFLLVTFLIALVNMQTDTLATRDGLWSGRMLVLSFMAGLVAFSWKDHIPLRGDLALLGLAMVTLLPMVHDGFAYLAPFLIAYGTTYLGLRNPPRNAIIDSGDYSYGLYLYSNPIEQTVQYALPGAEWYTNAMIALPITIVFALFSWWCIERPFQKVKRHVLAKRTEPPAATTVPIGDSAGGRLRSRNHAGEVGAP